MRQGRCGGIRRSNGGCGGRCDGKGGIGRVEVEDVNAGVVSGEDVGGREADTGCTTCDYSDFAVKIGDVGVGDVEGGHFATGSDGLNDGWL